MASQQRGSRDSRQYSAASLLQAAAWCHTQCARRHGPSAVSLRHTQVALPGTSVVEGDERRGLSLHLL